MNPINKIRFQLILACLSVVGWAASAGAFGGFIENRGQVDSRVKYYAPGSQAAVYFTQDALVIDLKEEARNSQGRGPHEMPYEEMEASVADSSPQKGCAIYVRFEGANPSPVVEGGGEPVTRYNYFLGNDPRTWSTDVPAYGELVYRDLWPGIDLVFRQESGVLTYSVSVASGGNAQQVRLRLEGADALTPLADGSVEVETMVGSLVHTKLVGEVGGGEFRVSGQQGCREAEEAPLADMDDPTALLGSTFWSTYLGGSRSDIGYDLCLDSSGNPVISGCSESSDFPATPGAYDGSLNGPCDVFVCKLSASGTSVLWSTYLGGSGAEWGYGICLDSSGNPIVTGIAWSSDFPTTPGAYGELFNGGECDGFVCKLSSSGSSLVWSTFLGGSDLDACNAVCLDSSGNPVVVGMTFSSDFPTTVGAYDESFNGSDDAFVCKLSSSGSSLAWSTFLGGEGEESGDDLCLDPSGNPVVVGWTCSYFPTTPGAYDSSPNGGACDGFVCKLSSSGSSLIWSTFLGSTELDGCSGVCLDSLDNPVVMGTTYSCDFPTTPGAYDESYNGGRDAFVCALSSSGSSLLWSTYLGGSLTDFIWDLCVDSSGSPVVTGETESPDFPTQPGAYLATSYGSRDLFVCGFGPSASSLAWVRILGGVNRDRGRAVSLDPSGNPVVVGYTESADFPTTAGAYDRLYNGGNDVFVAKFEIDDPSGVNLEDSGVRSAKLYPSFPNPFRASTSVQFYLPRRQRVSIALYDVRGQLVRNLTDGITDPGMHQIHWDGRSGTHGEAAPGVYFVRMESGAYRATRKVVVLK